MGKGSKFNRRGPEGEGRKRGVKGVREGREGKKRGPRRGREGKKRGDEREEESRGEECTTAPNKNE